MKYNHNFHFLNLLLDDSFNHYSSRVIGKSVRLDQVLIALWFLKYRLQWQ